MRRAATAAGLAVGLAGLAGLLCVPASAGFSASAVGGSLPARTATLLGPASLTATPSCNGLLVAKVVLTWPVTTSAFATGYVLSRRLAGVGPYATVATLSDITTTTFTDGSLAIGTSYQYVVQSTFRQWTGASPVASAATPVACVL